MTTLRWTLDDLRTARNQLSKRDLDANQQARLEEIADHAHDLAADAAEYGYEATA